MLITAIIFLSIEFYTIGAALAKDMAKAGATVVLSARRVDQLEKISQQCKNMQPKGSMEPLILPLDVTDFDAQKKAVDIVLKKFGKIDSLVLNAGRSQRNTAGSLSLITITIRKLLIIITNYTFKWKLQYP